MSSQSLNPAPPSRPDRTPRMTLPYELIGLEENGSRREIMIKHEDVSLPSTPKRGGFAAGQKRRQRTITDPQPSTIPMVTPPTPTPRNVSFPHSISSPLPLKASRSLARRHSASNLPSPLPKLKEKPLLIPTATPPKNRIRRKPAPRLTTSDGLELERAEGRIAGAASVGNLKSLAARQRGVGEEVPDVPALGDAWSKATGKEVPPKSSPPAGQDGEAKVSLKSSGPVTTKSPDKSTEGGSLIKDTGLSPTKNGTLYPTQGSLSSTSSLPLLASLSSMSLFSSGPATPIGPDRIKRISYDELEEIGTPTETSATEMVEGFPFPDMQDRGSWSPVTPEHLIGKALLGSSPRQGQRLRSSPSPKGSPDVGAGDFVIGEPTPEAESPYTATIQTATFSKQVTPLRDTSDVGREKAFRIEVESPMIGQHARLTLSPPAGRPAMLRNESSEGGVSFPTSVSTPDSKRGGGSEDLEQDEEEDEKRMRELSKASEETVVGFGELEEMEETVEARPENRRSETEEERDAAERRHRLASGYWDHSIYLGHHPTSFIQLRTPIAEKAETVENSQAGIAELQRTPPKSRPSVHRAISWEPSMSPLRISFGARAADQEVTAGLRMLGEEETPRSSGRGDLSKGMPFSPSPVKAKMGMPEEEAPFARRRTALKTGSTDMRNRVSVWSASTAATEESDTRHGDEGGVREEESEESKSAVTPVQTERKMSTGKVETPKSEKRSGRIMNYEQEGGSGVKVTPQSTPGHSSFESFSPFLDGSSFDDVLFSGTPPIPGPRRTIASQFPSPPSGLHPQNHDSGSQKEQVLKTAVLKALSQDIGDTRYPLQMSPSSNLTPQLLLHTPTPPGSPSAEKKGVRGATRTTPASPLPRDGFSAERNTPKKMFKMSPGRSAGTPKPKNSPSKSFGSHRHARLASDNSVETQSGPADSPLTISSPDFPNKGKPLRYGDIRTTPPISSRSMQALQSPIRDTQSRPVRSPKPSAIRTRGEDMRMGPLGMLTPDALASSRSSSATSERFEHDGMVGERALKREYEMSWKDRFCGCLRF